MEPAARSHVFVVRDGKILVLQQAGGMRWWEHPGGTLESGESEQDAPVRETFEETGLRIEAPDLLRTWSYRNARGDHVRCYAFVAEAPEGGIHLSAEHTAYAWMSIDDYELQYCNEGFDEAIPHRADFFAGMRENCYIARKWLFTRRVAS